MTTNIEVTDDFINQGVKPAKGKKDKVKNDNEFTVVQTIGLFLLTLVVSVGAWYYVGQKYIWTDVDVFRVKEQLKYYQQKVEAEPKNTQHRISLGYTYFLNGDNDKAIQEYKQAIELSKKDKIENFDAYYNIGLVYLDEKRYDDALENFDKCTKIAPRDHKGYIQKGITYRELKMYKEALASLEKANKLLPGSADIIYQIGFVAEKMGNKQSATDIYKEALSYDPLFKDAINGLDRLKKNK